MRGFDFGAMQRELDTNKLDAAEDNLLAMVLHTAWVQTPAEEEVPYIPADAAWLYNAKFKYAQHMRNERPGLTDEQWKRKG